MKKNAVVLFALTLLAVTFAWAETAPQSTSAHSVMASETLKTQVTTVELESLWEPPFLKMFKLNYICENSNACTFDRECLQGTCNNPTGQACAGTCC